VAQQIEQAAEAVNDETDNRTECLAEPFEKTFYLHVVSVLDESGGVVAGLEPWAIEQGAEFP
jgi:hypothetical protein